MSLPLTHFEKKMRTLQNKAVKASQHYGKPTLVGRHLATGEPIFAKSIKTAKETERSIQKKLKARRAEPVFTKQNAKRAAAQIVVEIKKTKKPKASKTLSLLDRMVARAKAVKKSDPLPDTEDKFVRDASDEITATVHKAYRELSFRLKEMYLQHLRDEDQAMKDEAAAKEAEATRTLHEVPKLEEDAPVPDDDESELVFQNYKAGCLPH